MYTPESDASYGKLKYLLSRTIAKKIGDLTSDEMIAQLDPDVGLTPVRLRSQLQHQVSSIASIATAAVFRADEGPMHRLFRESGDSITVFHNEMIDLADNSVSDTMMATLSIPRMAQSHALGIIADPRSQTAVRTFALSNEKPLISPKNEWDLAYLHNPRRLGYNPASDTIQTSAAPTDEGGCPVAKNRGRLIEDLFAVIAETTIRTVEWPAGHMRYPPA